MRKICFVIALIIFCSEVVTFGAELVVKHVRPESTDDKRHKYYIDMLRLALEKTKSTDGLFRLEMSGSRMYQDRALEQLKRKRGIDVVWTMTSKEREIGLMPVRIPLLKGLLGNRIFIIREGEEARFAAIQTFEELAQLEAGQGSDWPDTRILEANGIKVIGGINYQGLFRMLQRKRFDYFPRGVNEPWAEVKAHKDKHLVVEKTLLIQYPAPIYFFVHSRNTSLANRLERGLRLAIKDGSFDNLFRHHPANKEVFDLANMEHRKIFRLRNPFLSPETPFEDKELWYVSSDMKEPTED